MGLFKSFWRISAKLIIGVILFRLFLKYFNGSLTDPAKSLNQDLPWGEIGSFLTITRNFTLKIFILALLCIVGEAIYAICRKNSDRNS